MQDKINILINQYGGKHNKFVQTDYIKNNQWGHIDPTKRKGAWVSSFYNPTLKQEVLGLDDGVCAGLVSAYLASGRQWDSFARYIQTESGKSLIRGIHNIQKQLIDNRKNKLYHDQLTKIDIIRTAVKDKGVIYNKVKKLPVTHYPETLSRDVLRNLDIRTGYYFSIHFNRCGHALGVRVSQDTIKFFDPNFGEFILPYHNGNGENMASFIGRFLQMIYPKLDGFDVLHFKVL